MNWFYHTDNDTFVSDEEANDAFFKNELNYSRPGNSEYTCGINISLYEKQSNYINSIIITIKGKTLIIVCLFSLLKGSDVPTKPMNVSSFVLNTTTVMIEWVIPSVTYTPETYTIHYHSLSCPHNGSVSVTGNTSVEIFTQQTNTQYSKSIDGLKPGIIYTFYVSSMNTEGHTISDDETFYAFESSM